MLSFPKMLTYNYDWFLHFYGNSPTFIFPYFFGINSVKFSNNITVVWKYYKRNAEISIICVPEKYDFSYSKYKKKESFTSNYNNKVQFEAIITENLPTVTKLFTIYISFYKLQSRLYVQCKRNLYNDIQNMKSIYKR